MIPCETVITVDSASMQTPIVGLVTENIYHAGKLVIPAGTEVHGTAATARHRERISSGKYTILLGSKFGLSSLLRVSAAFTKTGFCPAVTHGK